MFFLRTITYELIKLYNRIRPSEISSVCKGYIISYFALSSKETIYFVNLLLSDSKLRNVYRQKPGTHRWDV